MRSNPSLRLLWLSGITLASYLTMTRCPAQDCAGLKPETTASLEARKPAECSLDPRAPACQRIRPDSSHPIFAGTVMSITESDGHMLLDGHCTQTSLQTVKVRVDKTYFGSTGAVVTIHAGDINGFYFNSHRRYLVYARPQPDGSFAVTSCGGTKLLKDAGDDISYLEHWNSLPKTVSIFGSTLLDHPDRGRMVNLAATSLASQEVIVNDPVVRKLTTDRSGAFQATGLPPGTYTVTVNIGSHTWHDRSQTVTIVERGCAKVDFVAMPSRLADGSLPPAVSGAKR